MSAPYARYIIVVPQDEREDDELEPLVDALERDLERVLDEHRERGLAIERLVDV